MSSRFRIFAFAAGALFLLNLLGWNSAATLWSGGEAALWWFSHTEKGPTGLPGIFLSSLSNLETDLVWARWLSGTLLIVSLLLFNWMGQKVFTRERVILSLLVMVSSLLLPNFGKIATADMYLFVAHFGGFLSLVLFLKQPGMLWRSLTYFFLFLGLWLHPLSSLVFWTILYLWLWRRHSGGGGLNQLWLWAAGPSMLLLLAVLGAFYWSPEGFVFSLTRLSFGKFLLYSLIGVAPFWGYLLGGLRDNALMLGKKEEQAVIYTGGLLAGFFAMSISWQAFLALIIAKQLTVYFKENYPFQDWVKVGALIHLFLVFCFAFILLYNGFVYFEGDGYRAGVALSGSYWALSFVGIIGLYGKRRALAIGATLLSGLIGTSFFWLQLYPLVESKRSLVKEIINEAKKEAPANAPLYIWRESRSILPNVAVYGTAQFDEVILMTDTDRFQQALEEGKGIGILKQSQAYVLPEGKTLDTLQVGAWSDWLVAEDWIIIRPPDK